MIMWKLCEKAKTKVGILCKIRQFRDWSLITGKGGYKTEGGACEVLPLRKGLTDFF